MSVDDESIPEGFLPEETVFHYTRLNTALEKILGEGKLRLALRGESNDPHEYLNFELMWSYTGATMPEMTAVNKAGLSATEAVERFIREKVRHVCFCMNSRDYGGFLDHREESKLDRYGFFRPRMWSQYGEGNRGVCLAFASKELVAELQAVKAQQDEVFFDEVKYHGYPIVPITSRVVNVYSTSISTVEDVAKGFVSYRRKEWLFGKHRDFQDESECRIVVFDLSGSLEYASIEKSIRGIVLGERFANVYSNVARELASRFRVPVRKIAFYNGRPELVEV